MSPTQIRDAKFLAIWWDERNRIGVDWKETTAATTDEQFKMELTLLPNSISGLA